MYLGKGKEKKKKRKVIPLELNVKSGLRISVYSKYVVADSPSGGESPAEATGSDRGKLRQAAAMS